MYYLHLGGSANALARSVAYISTKNHSAEVPEDRNGYVKFCSEVALKGKAAPMDLARVKTKDGRVYTSCLSFGLGLLSDIDIDSEVLR